MHCKTSGVSDYFAQGICFSTFKASLPKFIMPRQFTEILIASFSVQSFSFQVYVMKFCFSRSLYLFLNFCAGDRICNFMSSCR